MIVKYFEHPAYIVIDDVLSNPDDLLSLSKKAQYYSSKTKNPLNFNGEQWKGYRSLCLGKEQKTPFFDQIAKKFMNVFFDIPSITNISLNFEVRACFHYMTKEFAVDDTQSWNHIDGGDLFAGVLYLNKKPKKNSGTVLYNGDEKIVIENKYNRMVMYRSDILHAPDVGSAYGTNLSNSRLTLVFFNNKISISAAKFK